MSNYNFSYSSIADVYAVAEDVEGTEKEKMIEFAKELERMGIASYEGTEYIYRNTDYGMEIVSMEDYQSENDEDEEYD